MIAQYRGPDDDWTKALVQKDFGDGTFHIKWTGVNASTPASRLQVDRIKKFVPAKDKPDVARLAAYGVGLEARLRHNCMCGKQFETERMLHTHQQWCAQVAKSTVGKQLVKMQTQADKNKEKAEKEAKVLTLTLTLTLIGRQRRRQRPGLIEAL